MTNMAIAVMGLGILGLWFYRAPLWIYTIIILGLAVSIFALGGWGVRFWVLALLGLWFAIFYIPWTRRYWIKPIYTWVRHRLPAMTETEQAALEAGDVWWESTLLAGAPDWTAWQSLPLSALSQEERDFLENQVETLCRLIQEWDVTHLHGDLPAAAWDYLKKESRAGDSATQRKR